MPQQPRVTLRVATNRVETLTELVRATYEGRARHAYHIRAIRLPKAKDGDEERIALVADLDDGMLLIAETTLPLLRQVVDALTPSKTH